MKILACLIVAASTALAVPPIAPPRITLPVIDSCMFDLLREINRLRFLCDTRQITEQQRQAMVRTAFMVYNACRKMTEPDQVRPPYSERQGD